MSDRIRHAPAMALALAGLTTAGAQSLCDDFHVPAAYIGNVQGCVFDGGNTTTISFSAPAVLEWNRGFRINANQHLRFDFQGMPNGAVLNRDVSGRFSNISGTVSSDGRVMLINPGGDIFVQPGAMIDADGGFLASTLDTSDDAALLAGEGAEFFGNRTSSIGNFGTIQSAAGDVILISESVTNLPGARILAQSGRVHIGAATRLRLAAPGEQRIAVLEGNRQHLITNSGEIVAGSSIDLNSFTPPDGQAGASINNTGTIRTETPDGRIFLRTFEGNGLVLNSDTGVVVGGAVAVVGDLTNQGIMLETDDGANPGATTATRQFARLTSSGLSQTAATDFRLVRASFSHVNGLESNIGKKAKPTATRRSKVTASTTTRGASDASKKKTSTSGKKIVLRRSAFFGKRSQ